MSRSGALPSIKTWFGFLLALPIMARKDIVFGFIIEYSSLRDLDPNVIIIIIIIIIGLFLYEDF
jgi:hypothetical protein